MKTLSTCLAVSALTLLSVNAFAVGAVDGNPATYGAQASIQILQPISISETTAMAFPATGAPTTGSVDVANSADGVFAISGEAGEAYAYSYLAQTCTAPGLSLTILSLDGTSLFDGGGADSLTVDGEMQVSAGAGVGSQSCNYMVTANY